MGLTRVRGEILKSICRQKGVEFHSRKIVLEWFDNDGDERVIKVYNELHAGCSRRTAALLSLFTALKPELAAKSPFENPQRCFPYQL